METIMHILGAGASAIFAGGATGLLGGFLQKGMDLLKGWQDMKLLQARQAHELAMRDKDAQLMDREWAGRLKVAQTEGDTAKDVAASKAFEASMFREPERYSDSGKLTVAQQWIMVILDFCRGIVRPGLTVYFCMLTTYVWWQVRQLLSVEDLAPDAVLELWKLVVSTVLYLTTTIVLWWFATRNQQQQPQAIFR